MPAGNSKSDLRQVIATSFQCEKCFYVFSIEEKVACQLQSWQAVQWAEL